MRRSYPALAFWLTLAAAWPAARVCAQDDALDAEPEAAEPEAAEPVESRPFSAQLGAGMGVGLRNVTLPSPAGERRIATGPFPALDVDLHAEQLLSAHFFVGARLRYQTSIGLIGRETPYGGATHQTPLRAHHFEGGIEPGFRLGDSAESVSLAAFFGYGVRALRTESGLSVPDYSLHGPVARLQLRAPLGTDAVVLRLAPEVIAWLGQTGALRKAGSLEAFGVAFGGEASLRIELAPGWGLELAYRGSYATIASGLGGSLTDTEHFATLQLLLLY